MGLFDLLKDPNSYRIGGGSKGLDYPEGQGPLLGKRVSFDVTDDLANPTFEYGGDGYTRGTIDQFVRGGTKYAAEAREIDYDRIKAFLGTPNGGLFIQKQLILQALNPRKPQIYNLGINTLHSVRTAGVSNVKRGGILSLGGFDVAEALGASVDYITDEQFKGPDGKKGGLLRENRYHLGDPGKPASEDILEKIIGFNPFKKKQGYDVYLDSKIDKVNLLPVFKISNKIPDFLEQAAKDFVPFRFEVVNQDGGDNDVIVFRAFLDSVSDDYSATHNTIKYNGRGEEFFTYNKFNRKIQVSFKVAAQSRFEMKPIYQKLNYLAAQTAPNYSSTGRIRTPYLYLTIGHWFNKIPGLITQVGLSWQKDYPWEIALDRTIHEDGIEGKDRDMLILPHVLDVSLSFQPIHKFTPSNDITSPFIGIDGEDYGDSGWIEQSTKVDTIGEMGWQYNQKLIREEGDKTSGDSIRQVPAPGQSKPF